MKNLLTLFALFILISCSKDEPSPAEQIENNTDLLTGEWVSYYFLHNNERNISPQPITLTFNSAEKTILWSQPFFESTRDSVFVVLYSISNDKINLSYPNDPRFTGEITSIKPEKIEIEVASFLNEYNKLNRIFEKGE